MKNLLKKLIFTRAQSKFIFLSQAFYIIYKFGHAITHGTISTEFLIQFYCKHFLCAFFKMHEFRI